MANGEVSIVADLNVDKINEALTKLDNHISDTTKRMGISINEMTTRVESSIRNMNKTVDSALDSGSSSKSSKERATALKAEESSYTALTAEMKKADAQVKAGNITFNDWFRTLRMVQSGLNDVNGSLMQVNLTNTKVKPLSYLNTSQISQIQNPNQSVDFSSMDYRQLEQSIKVIQNQMAVLEGGGRDAMQPFIDKLREAQAQLKISKKSTDELTLAQQKLQDAAFGAQVKSQFEAPIGSDEQLTKMREYYEEQERLSAESAKLQQQRSEEVFGAQVKSQFEAPIGSDEQLTKMREYYEEQEKLSAESAKLQQQRSEEVFGAQIESMYQPDLDYTAQQEQLKQMYAEQEAQAQRYLKTSEGIATLDNKSIDAIQRKTQAYDEYLRKIDISTKEGEEEYRSIQKINNELKERLSIIQQTPALTTTQLQGLDEGSITKNTAKIKEYQRALKDLNDVNGKNATTARRYRTEIERLTTANQKALGSVNNLNASTSRLGNAFENLGSRIIAYTVYASLGNFVRQMINIRGQFEQTQIALGAMLDDVDEAQRQFDLIQQQALKSPFSIMELTTATKQLAAYNIEVEKINPTMQMLADVSAGVAVPMERLVYNFGQIRAQTVLNGRELRDFANAGVPVLQELADMYSEVQGRMVTTGEVFDMVSNRMVSFQDVEQVFQRLTSEGGIFFNMQIELAESLRGRISNLQDAYQIMLNSIGESSQGVLSGAVSAVTALLANWEAVARTLWTVIAAYGAYRAVDLFGTIKKQIMALQLSNKYQALSTLLSKNKTKQVVLEMLATKGLTASQHNLERATKLVNLQNKKMLAFGNPYALLLAGVVALGVGIYQAVKASTALQKELDKIESEGLAASVTSVQRFEVLADVISDASRSADEHKDAMAELKRTYGDIIPEQDLTIAKIREMKGNYEALTIAIQDNARATLLQNQISLVQKEYSKDIADSSEDLADALEKQGISSAQSSAIILEAQRQNIKSGKEFVELIKEMTGVDVGSLSEVEFVSSGYGGFHTEVFTKVGKAIKGVIGAYTELNTKIEELTTAQRTEYREYGILAEAMDNITKKGGEADKALEKFLQTTREETGKEYKVQFDSEFAYNEALTQKRAEILVEQVEKLIKNELGVDVDLGDAMSFDATSVAPKIEEALKDATQFNLYEGSYLAQIMPDVFGTKKVEVNPSLITGFEKTAEGLGDEIKTLMGGDISRLSKAQFKDAADYAGINIDRISRFIRADAQGREEWAKMVVGAYDSAIAAEAAYSNDAVNNEAQKDKALAEGNTLLAQRYALTVKANQEEATKNAENAKALKYIIDLEKLQSTQGRKGEDTVLKNLRLQLGLINEISKAYRDSGGDAEAVTDIYSNAFNTIFKGQDKIKLTDLFTFDDAKILEAVENVKVKGSKDAIELKTETTTKMKVELLVDTNEQSLSVAQTKLDNLFQSYQVGVEIDEAGAYGSIFAQLFDMKGIDLTTLETEVNKILSGLYNSTELQSAANEIIDLQNKISSGNGTEADAKRLAELQTYYSNQTKLAVDAEAQLKKIQDDATKDRVKQYYDLLSEYATFEQRKQQIANETEKAIADARKIYADDSETQKVVVDALERQRTEQTASLELEEIEGERLWQQAFGDTEDIATQSIQPIIAMLQKMSQVVGLPIEDIERLQEKLSDLRDLELERMNPFDAVKESIVQVDEAINVFDDAKMALTFAKASGDINEIAIAEKNVDVAANNAQQALNRQQVQLERTRQIVSDFASGLTDASSSASDFVSALSSGELSEFAEDLFDSIDAVGDGVANTIGIMEMLVDSAGNSMSLSAYMASTAISSVEKASVVLAVINTALQVATAIANIIPTKNKKIDDSIEKSESKVRELEYAYNDLERAMESALGSDAVKAQKDMVANLEAQREELEKQLALERSRSGKKYNQEAVDSLKGEIQAIGYEIEDTTNAIVDNVFASTQDLATNLAEVWLDAYKAGDDAFKALEESFAETMDNMLVQAIMAKAIESQVQKIWDGVENALKDNTIDPSEWTDIEGSIAEGTSVIDTILQGIADRYGVSVTPTEEESGMSDLQKGIQSASETTMLAVEAAMNTLINNSFVTREINERIATLSFDTLAVNQQMLTALLIGNADRKAILESIRGVISEDGRAIRALI